MRIILTDAEVADLRKAASESKDKVLLIAVAHIETLRDWIRKDPARAAACHYLGEKR